MSQSNDSIGTVFNNIKENLYNPDYWLTQSPNEWTLLDYFMSSIAANPTLTKHTAHSNFLSDIREVKKAFPENINITKVTTSLSTSISKENNTVVDMFWREKAPKLRIDAMNNKTELVELGSHQKSQATKMVLREKRKSSASTQASTQAAKKKNKTEEPLVESDKLYLSGHMSSISTLIKRNALELFELHKNELNKISLRKRKMISNGLSSILDLVDQSFNSQRSLFKPNEWNTINKYFDSMYSSIPVSLNDDISDTITIVSNILNLSSNFKASLTYIRDMQNKYETSSFELAAFRVLEVTLTLLIRYGYLFDRRSKKKVLENDYLRLVWSPILEALFPPEESIRLIAAESVSKVSSEAKKDQYPNKKSVRGFKIDTRLVLDIDDKDIDLAVGEIGKHPDDNKAISDEGKLMREGKETLDGLVRSIDDSEVLFQSYMMQFTGCSCVLSKINLAARGLYVATHVHSFDLPSSVSDFPKIKDIIIHLLTMKRELNTIANKLTERSDAISTSGSLNREERRHTNEKLSWIRDTWHTPPPEMMPKLPVLLYVPPDAPTCDRIVIGDPNNVAESSKTSTADYVGTPDSHGWAPTVDGKYYNIYLKQTRDKHPLDKKN